MSETSSQISDPPAIYSRESFGRQNLPPTPILPASPNQSEVELSEVYIQDTIASKRQSQYSENPEEAGLPNSSDPEAASESGQDKAEAERATIPLDEADLERILSPILSNRSTLQGKSGAKPTLGQQLFSLNNQCVSYKELRNHIDHNHPTKLDPAQGKQVQFGLCESLGRLQIFHCCRKCCPTEVTEMARQIGVGPSLFLMIVKSMTTLFLILTLINLPVMWLFNRGSRIQRENPLMKLKLSDEFARLSLGNIGREEFICSTSPLFSKEAAEQVLFQIETGVVDKNIHLSCQEDEHIDIYEIGLVRDYDICYKMASEDFADTTDSFWDMLYDSFVEQELGCTYYYYEGEEAGLDTPEREALFASLFDSCNGKQSCQVSIEKYMQLSYDLNYENCRGTVEQSFKELEPASYLAMVVVGNCNGEAMQNRTKLAYVLFYTDAATAAAIMLFVWFLDNSSKQFAKQFANQTLEMNDFAIRVKPMPHQDKYQHNDEILRAHLVAHFEDVVREQYFAERIKQASQEGEELSREAIEAEISKQLSKNKIQSMPWEVADISFGKREMGEVLYLERLADIQSKFMKAQIKIKKTKDMMDRMKLSLASQTFKKMFEIQKEKLIEMRDSSRIDGTDPEIRYAYVTFRSMRATDLALKAYSAGWFKRRCALGCCGGSCYNGLSPSLLRKHFFSSWPSITRACLPEYIKPENLGYTAKERNFRWALTWVIALVIIAFTITSVIALKTIADDLREDQARFPTTLHCEESDLSENCRCLNWVSIGEWGTLMKDSHCVKFAGKYAMINFLQSASAGVIVVLNIVACVVFEKMASFEKNHTTNDETKSSFFKIALLQYVNISIVILVVNFGFLDKPAFGYIPIFKGNHHDFTIQWYTEVGKTLGMTLFMQMFTPHASKIAQPLIKVYQRYRDRGGTNHLKIKDAEDGQDVNTKLLLQDEVNELYTGTQISMQYVLAQIYTYFWCVLTFSTGMPILYLLGCGFFAIFYWVYKGLLLRFYARSSSFSEDLLIQSVGLIKYGVLFHLICGSQMITYLFKKLEKNEKETEVNVFKQLFERYFRNEVGEVYSILLGCFVLALIFRSTVLALTYRIGKACVRRWSKKQGVLVSKDQEEFSDDIFKDLQLSFLESLYVKACLERDRFCKIGNSDIAQESAKFRKTEETEVSSEAYSRFLDRRVQQIEGVIDDHILALHGSDGLAMINDRKMGPRSKLKYLLQKKDQIPREQRLRLVGVTQSYDVYQSVKYQRVKDVKEMLQDDPDYQLGQ